MAQNGSGSYGAAYWIRIKLQDGITFRAEPSAVRGHMDREAIRIPRMSLTIRRLVVQADLFAFSGRLSFLQRIGMHW